VQYCGYRIQYCGYRILADALHRQIGNSHGKSLLLRENEQRRREGPAHGHTRHESSVHAHCRHVGSKITCLHPTGGMVRAKANGQEGPSTSLARSSTAACAERLVEGRGNVRFALGVHAWCRRQASESLQVRARMTYSHTTWCQWCGRLMHSQVVEVQWSSHTIEIYDWPCGWQLAVVLVHTSVQWSATRCRTRCARADRVRHLVCGVFHVC
jgi:hypothetical protein